MKTIHAGFVCITVLICLVMGGCAKPPTEEMNKAVEAVTRAENDADAVMYAGNTLARALDALKRMQSEADSKRYDAAKTYAAEAVTAAEKAIADGRAGAARAREEAAALVAGLRPAIAETEQGISAARSAGLPLDFVNMGQELDGVRRSTDQAEVALAGDQYQDALEKGRNARAGLNDIDQQLSSAVMAVSRKK
ncbi:MAG: hypothetical protein LBD48_10045 [Treponema sp.]|jgi:hypothetical protein|nr:hypothetical protein [Treponema sp.]